MIDLKSKKLLVIVDNKNKVSTVTQILNDAGFTEFSILSTDGPITTIEDSRNSFQNAGIYPEKDFEFKLNIWANKQATVRKLKLAASLSDLICILTEPGELGTLLTWSLATVLSLSEEQYIHSIIKNMTPEEVLYSLEHPILMQENKVAAMQARMVIDKLTNYTLTPLAKTHLNTRSIGRLQCAALKILVDREREIINFQARDKFGLSLRILRRSNNYEAAYIETTNHEVKYFSSADEASKIKLECTSDFIIKDIQKTTRMIPSPKPLTTATLLQECCATLNISSKVAMTQAQKLFDGIKLNGHFTSLISNIKTDSTLLPLNIKTKLQKYLFDNSFLDTILDTSDTIDNDKENEDCIYCLDPNLTPTILAKCTSNQILVAIYKLIWQRTIASELPPAKILDTTYIIENNGYQFKFTTPQIIEAGYKKIYKYESDTTAYVNTDAQIYNYGDKILNCTLVETYQKTQPPVRFSEATLIQTLASLHICNAFTLVNTVDTLLDPTRSYCNLILDQIIPTMRGLQLIYFLEDSLPDFVNIKATEDAENSLAEIANGLIDKNEFLVTIYERLKLLVAIENKKLELIVGNETSKYCPNCGRPLVIKRNRYGDLFYGCPSFPKCKGALSMNKSK